MSAADAFPLPEPTQDERTMAVLAHALQLVGWWIAPLIIFLMRRQSRFVAFHALQALLLQITIILFWLIVVVVFVASMLAGIAAQTQQSASPEALFLLFPLFWLGAMGAWMAVLLCAIIYSIKAARGEWAAYPVIGRVAMRILKIPPDGLNRRPESL